MGDARARRRRADRWARGRDPHPPGRADRGAHHRCATCWPSTSRRADGLTGARPRRARPPAARWSSRSAARFHQVVGDDVRRALLEFARAENATQLVLGASRRGRLGGVPAGAGIGVDRVTAAVRPDRRAHRHARGALDPRRHVSVPGRRLTTALSRRRRLPAVLLARARARRCSRSRCLARADDLNLPSDILLLPGGRRRRRAGRRSVAGARRRRGGSARCSTTASPRRCTRFTIAERNNALALVVFVAVAAAGQPRRRRAPRGVRGGRRAQAEAATLAALAGSVLRGETALPACSSGLRETFGLTSVDPARAGRDEEWRAGRGGAGDDRPGDGRRDLPVERAADACALARAAAARRRTAGS